MLQLQHTPLPQSTTPGLHAVSIHQMSPLVRGSKHPITAYYSIYRPGKDERLSRPGWLVTYRNKVPPPGVEPRHVTHPRTNRARRSVTSLIRPTTLPLRHAKTTKTTLFITGLHNVQVLSCWLTSVVVCCLSSSSVVVCNAAACGPTGRKVHGNAVWERCQRSGRPGARTVGALVPGTWAVWQLTLHGGPVTVTSC